MTLPQSIWDAAIIETQKRIQFNPQFNSVYNLAASVSLSSLYLAGGKVFRTLAEVIYGGDFGSKDADWDFVSMDTSTVAPFTFWVPVRGPTLPKPTKYSSKSPCGVGQNLSLNRSWRFEWQQTSQKISVDIVAIEDVPGIGLQDYLDAVPLNIQSIAFLLLDSNKFLVNNWFLFGTNGSKALRDKILSWNNKNKLLPHPGNSPELYFDGKLATLPGFQDGRKSTPNTTSTITFNPYASEIKYQPYSPKVEKKCTCSSFDLFSKGCKCGAITPYENKVFK